MENKAKYASSTFKKAIFIAIAGISIVALYLLFFNKKKRQDNQAYAKYVESYTSGTISKKSYIRVHLASAVKSLNDIGKPDERALLDFSPNIKGKTYWIDAQTLEFRPDEPLKPDQVYEATLNLAAITTTEKGLEEFDFDFKVIKPGLT